MGSTETIEEMKERNTALDSCQMGNASQIHDLLNRTAAKHCKTGLSGCHYIRVLSENGECVGSYGTGTYMKDTWV